jgi:hypothetical protein
MSISFMFLVLEYDEIVVILRPLIFIKFMEKIGNRIKTVLFSQHRSAKWLAEQIPCERTNVYDIFKRADINVNLLKQISIILKHDFFKELSEDTFPKSRK